MSVVIPDPRWEMPELLTPGKKPTGNVVISESGKHSITGYWLFNEGGGLVCHDMQGTNDGVLTGMTSSDWKIDEGTCLDFNSTSAYVDLGQKGLDLLRGKQYTISILVKPNGAMGNLDGLISGNQTAPYPFTIRHHLGELKVVINNTSTLSFGEALAADVWSYVTVKFNDAIGLEVYINGVSKASNTYKILVKDNNDTLRIGRDYLGATRSFVGKVKFLMICDRALSDSAIFSLAHDPYQDVIPA